VNKENIFQIFENAIISTGSKKFWSKDLIKQVVEETQDLEKLQRILEYFMVQGQEFKYSTIIELTKPKPKLPKLTQEENEEYKELAQHMLDIINQAYNTCKTEVEFYEEIETVAKALEKLGMWKKKGKWHEWRVKHEKI